MTHKHPISLQKFCALGPFFLAQLLLSYWQRFSYSLLVVEIAALVSSIGVLVHATWALRDELLLGTIGGGGFVLLIIVLQSLCLYLHYSIRRKRSNSTHQTKLEPTERQGDASAKLLERLPFYLSVATLACYAVCMAYTATWFYVSSQNAGRSASIASIIAISIAIVFVMLGACGILQVYYSRKQSIPKTVIIISAISLVVEILVAASALVMAGSLSALGGNDFLLFSLGLQIAWISMQNTTLREKESTSVRSKE